jgi:hypothetical protein
MENKSFCAVCCGKRGKRNSFYPVGCKVNDGKYEIAIISKL